MLQHGMRRENLGMLMSHNVTNVMSPWQLTRMNSVSETFNFGTKLMLQVLTTTMKDTSTRWLTLGSPREGFIDHRQ